MFTLIFPCVYTYIPYAKSKDTSYGLWVAQTTNIYLPQIKSQNKVRIHLTKQHRYNTNQITLIPNNLTVMMALIPPVHNFRGSL